VTWRFAVATGGCNDRPIITVIDALYRAGVTAVELGTPSGHFDPISHETVRALRNRLRQLSILPVAIHAPFGGLLDLTDPNPHHRHAAIGAILSAATAVREVGGRRVIVHVSDVPRNNHNVRLRLAHAVEALSVLERALRQMSVTLIVETPPPHLIGGHPDEFAAVIGSLSPSVGVCLDVSHTTLGHHWDEFLQSVGHRLAHVHASDHRGYTDDHLPPGNGTIDWQHVRRGLERAGFEGWIVLELLCPEDGLTAYVEAAMRQTRALFEGE
jgi:sugar phosphate isomerase/epimerase